MKKRRRKNRRARPEHTRDAARARVDAEVSVVRESLAALKKQIEMGERAERRTDPFLWRDEERRLAWLLLLTRALPADDPVRAQGELVFMEKLHASTRDPSWRVGRG